MCSASPDSPLRSPNSPPVPHIALIQGSLSPNSKTSLVIEEARQVLADKKIDYTLIDLRKIDMQFCDGRDIKEYNEDMQRTYRELENCSGYIFGMPVYQYSVAGPLKNFIDIMAGAMDYKVAGILCNSGGVRSYLASADLMKSLSFESYVVTVQPTVHTWAEDFENNKIKNPKVREKISEMVDAMMKLVK